MEKVLAAFLPEKVSWVPFIYGTERRMHIRIISVLLWKFLLGKVRIMKGLI